MTPRFHLARGALFAAAAALSLLAAPQIAAAQPGNAASGIAAQAGNYYDPCAQPDRSACQSGQASQDLAVPYADQSNT